jgi:uncharacterized protein YecE (DUF72 family)
MGILRIGTSGWNYPKGKGSWNGLFYPATRSRRAGKKRSSPAGQFDELAFYAEHFDTVEINSTFYHIPSVETTQGWARRTPPNFEFSAKLFQKFTHPAMFAKAIKQDVPEPPTDADLDDWRRALDPIASAGKLGALLAQFPPSFKRDDQSVAYLEWLLRALQGFNVAVELRHRSWSDDLRTTLGLLNGHGAAWTQIDEPKFKFSIRQNYLPNITSFYYLRLHGRNVGAWWKHAASEDRYNYLYSSEELQPFVDTADAARHLVRKLYLYMNNHFEAKSVANALMVKRSLNEPIEGDYPESFVERFPELRDVLRTERAAGALF